MIGPEVIIFGSTLIAVSLFYFLLTKLRKSSKIVDETGENQMLQDTLNLPSSKLTITRAEAFQKARQAAIIIGRRWPYVVTSDDVYAQLQSEGIPVDVLGPAAGNVLRNKRLFIPTNEFVKSKRSSNHGRKIQKYLYVAI